MKIINEIFTSIKLSKREIRSGLNGFKIFIACIALGVFAISFVGLTSSNIQKSIDKNAKIILGGDVELSQRTNVFNDILINWITNNSLAHSQIVELRSMAKSSRDNNTPILVEIKSVDKNYPLTGKLEIRNSKDKSIFFSNKNKISLKENEIFAHQSLLNRLQVSVGDQISLGEKFFTIKGIIIDEPDNLSGFFTLGPRIIISSEGLNFSGLNNYGSLVNHKIRILLNHVTISQNWIIAFKKRFSNQNIRIQNYLNSQPSTSNFIRQMEVILLLASIIALLIGGIGVNNAVRKYMEDKKLTIATLKTFGAKGKIIFTTYLFQISYLSFVGIIVGLVLGVVSFFILSIFFSEFLQQTTLPSISIKPIIIASTYGFIVSLFFSVFPLAYAQALSPAILLRSFSYEKNYFLNYKYKLIFFSLLSGIIFLTIFLSFDSFFSYWFVAAAVISIFLFNYSSLFILDLLKKINIKQYNYLKIALKNLTRPAADTKNIILSFGIGLTLLVTIHLVHNNLKHQITSNIPEIAPSFFFIDIQKKEIHQLEREIKNFSGFLKMQSMPTLRGRLVKIDGVSIENINFSDDTKWIKRHDFGATFSKLQPNLTQIVEGKWWKENYTGAPVISVDKEIAESLNIGLGNELTFNILGREVTAKITSLRKINWTSFDINFFVIFSPGFLSNAPFTYLSTASYQSSAEPAAYSNLVTKFPTITIVRIKEVLEKLIVFLGNILIASSLITFITIIAGIFVLVGSISASQQNRIYESVILKLLGAKPADLLYIFFIEFLIIGILASIVAALLGNFLSWLIIKYVFSSVWVFSFLPTFLSPFFGIIIILFVGLISTRNILMQKPGPILRKLL